MARTTLPAPLADVLNSSITGGVDTHLDVHVAAALNAVGGLLGTESFPTTPAGYDALLAWLTAFGPVVQVGVEGTSSYGSGLTRTPAGRGHRRRRGGPAEPAEASPGR
jgi:transposase